MGVCGWQIAAVQPPTPYRTPDSTETRARLFPGLPQNCASSSASPPPISTLSLSPSMHSLAPRVGRPLQWPRQGQEANRKSSGAAKAT